jgi:alpha-tubulin suppressor-like RCC1 family protein
VLVHGLDDAVEVSVGEAHVCARRRTGHVVCWGMNTYGQLGDGTLLHRETPVRAVGLGDAAQIAVGTYFTCALRRGGAVACWGINALGQLGDGPAHRRCEKSHHTTDSFGKVDCSARPVVVPLKATQIAAGSGGACAVLASGGVSCWGYFPGDGAESGRATPFLIPWIHDAVDVSIGEWHACALGSSGRLTCWGRDDFVGNARHSSRSCPTRSARCVHGDPLPITAAPVVGVSAGSAGTCALHRSGALVCWSPECDGCER